LFALLTIGSFAIDPMIQQVLDTQQQEVQLHNMTASITSNNNYDSVAVKVRQASDNENNPNRKLEDVYLASYANTTRSQQTESRCSPSRLTFSTN